MKSQIYPIYVKNSLENIMYVLVTSQKKVYGIDPTDGEMMEKFVQNKNLKLDGLFITHEHGDHVAGISYLIDKYSCPVYAFSIKDATVKVREGDILELDDNSILKVIETPGHSPGHVCYLLYEDNEEVCLFSGDTIFSAGVGNCYGGNVESLYESINKLSGLSSSIKIYHGHDYIQKNLSFAQTMNPSNKNVERIRDLDEEKRKSGEIYFTTLYDEFLVNPFFRLDDEDIKQQLFKKGFSCESKLDVFKTLRELRNSF